MSVVSEISALFQFEFSIAGYLLEKAADAGTGKLWKCIRERLQQNKNSTIEAGLYTAIEKTTRALLPEGSPEESIAGVCELILASWCRHKYIKDEDIRSALGRFVFFNKVQPEDWLFLFYKNVYAEEALKDYVAMYQNREILQLLEQLTAGVSRELERPGSGLETDLKKAPEFGRIPDFGTRIRHGDLKEYVDGFVGRTKELSKIKEILASHKTAVITAGPGYGKTSLAVKFGQDYGKGYDCILFISCETAVDIYRSLNMIYENESACDLGVRGNILRRIKMLITGAIHPLLIFDNYGYDHIAEYQKLGALENALRAVIDELREDYEALDMIVTTRITKTLFGGQEIYNIKEMSDEDSIHYLKQGNVYFSDEECYTIIRDWGKLPIVLNMVKTVTQISGSYGAVSSIYMNLGGGVHDNLYLLFKKLFGELEASEEGRIFAEVLRLSCLLDSDHIQKDLLFRALSNSSMAAGRSRFDMIMANYVRRLNILRGTGSDYAIHRMYQETILHLLSTSRRQALLQCIVRELRDKLHWFSYYGYSEWERMKDYLNHIDRMYVAMDETERGAYADLFLQSAWYSGYVINDFALYEKYKKAIVSEKVAGAEAYIRGMALCDDILVHIHSGQKTAQIQTPGIWTRVKYLLKQLNGSQRGMLCARYCLCRSEYEANDGGYAKALGWAKFGVKTCENGRLAPEDNDTLRSTFFLEHLMLLKNQLGKLYRQQAQTDMALQMFSQVMDIINDIQSKAFEPDNNYDVIRVFTVNSMAVCYYERNRSNRDLKQALIYYKDAYDTYQRLQYYFGTVNELLNCAAVYRLLALNVLELCEGFEACEICAEQFRLEFKESLIPALSHRNENTDFEDGLKKELAPGLAVYQGYVYNARCCLEAIDGILNKGVKISKKLLKDFYMYHYELDIVRSRHPSAAPDQVREILEEAGAWLEKSIEIAEKEDYKTDRCRQERYQGVLYRKMAMLTEGGEQKAYLRRAIEILEAAVKHSDTYALRTSLYYARMELALACYYYGNAQRACHIIRTMENEVDGCSQDSVRKRYAAVRSMIGYTDEIN